MRHAVIANNTFVRTDGALVWGLNHQKPGMPEAFMPCYFVETFRNRVSDRRLQGSPHRHHREVGGGEGGPAGRDPAL